MSLNKKITSIGIAGVLAGCTSTTTNHAFGIIAPIMSLAGTALSQEDSSKEKKSVDDFLEIGPIYRHALVNKVSNVPDEIRTSVNPDYSWNGRVTVADDQVNVGPRTGGYLRYGIDFPIKDLSFKTGVEVELGGQVGSEQPKNGLYSYSIHTKAGPRWNSVVIPKVFAEAEARISDSFSVGAGYKIWSEDLVAEVIYESYDKYHRNYGKNLVDMTVGSAFGSLKYHTGNKSYLFLEVGTQNILNKRFHELGSESDIDFNDNSFTVSFGGNINF